MDRDRVGVRLDRAGVQQGAQLAREADLVRAFVVYERLLSKAISSEQQPLVGLVPQSEGEHPPHLRYDRLAPLFVAVNDDLDIGAAPHSVSAVLQIGAQLSVVVDLSVQNDVPGTRAVVDGLCTAVDVDYREAAKGEAGTAPDCYRGVIRPAVSERVAHRDERLTFRASSLGSHDAGNAAHRALRPTAERRTRRGGLAGSPESFPAHRTAATRVAMTTSCSSRLMPSKSGSTMQLS